MPKKKAKTVRKNAKKTTAKAQATKPKARKTRATVKPRTLVGAFLRETRERLGLTQAAFCKQLGAYQSYASQVEQGVRVLEPVTAAKWAKGIRVPQATLVGLAIRDLFRTKSLRLSVTVQGYNAGAKAAPAKNSAAKKKTSRVAAKKDAADEQGQVLEFGERMAS